MKSKALAKKIRRLESKLARQQEKLGAFKRKLPCAPVEDYTLAGPDGPVRLSALFGEKRDLIVVYNMGRACPYCTMWADGYNGLVPHLGDRAAFVVVSPDPPKAQQAFAQKRGWKFRLVSGRGSTFIEDMGFKDKDGWQPGVSTFHRAGKKIHRVASAPFGSFDPFCATWHFFNLLADGVSGWSPKYRY